MRARRLLARFVALVAVALVALPIITVLRAPNALLARAEDAKVATKVLAGDRDLRADVPPGPFIAGNGTVEPRGGVVRVAGTVSGRVREVRVRIGDHVAASQALVELDSAPEVARVELAAAEVVALEQELAATGAGRREDAEAARAEAAAAVAKAKLSLDASERSRRLASASAITEAARVKTELEAEVDEANARAAALRAEAVQRGARAEVRLASRARVRAARARLALAEIELEQRTIRAPRAGDVLDVVVRAGERYGADGDPAILLGDASDMTVRLELDERSILRVNVGAKVLVRSPSEPGRDLQGKVLELAARMGRKRTRGDDPSEPTDLRVRDVIVALDPRHPLIPGQRVAAFVEGSP